MARSLKQRQESFREHVTAWAPDVKVVAYRGFTPEIVASAAIEAAMLEPKLLFCTKASVYLALLQVARWGLHVGEGIHLVPVDRVDQRPGKPNRIVWECHAWPSYVGLKALASRQRLIRLMSEYEVYEGDYYDYQLGSDAYLRHQPAAAGRRGPLIAAYAIIDRPGGSRTFHQMCIEDIELVRAKSRKWSPAHGIAECPPWYATKTVGRDYLNRQPKAGALAEALERDDTTRVTLPRSLAAALESTRAAA